MSLFVLPLSPPVHYHLTCTDEAYHLCEENTGIEDDFNGDGRNNFTSYVFNSNPAAAQNPNFPTVGTAENGDLTMSFTLLDDPTLTWTVEVSSDGVDWTDGTEGTDYAIESQDAADGEVSYTLTLHPEGPTRLYRLAVE